MSQAAEPQTTESQTAAAPAEPKQITTRMRFSLRMKREGRYSEYQSVIDDVIRELGCDRRKAIGVAMRRLGFAGARKEKKKHQEWERVQAKTAMEIEAERLRLARSEKTKAEYAAIDEEQREFEFERAFASLPTVADPQTEWEWLGGHPAMMRKDRAKSDLKRIELSAEDILSPPHGIAPSKRAVLQLQHWCNAPREFYKAMIGVHKKQQEGEGASEVGQDEDLAEVERMLKEMIRG